MDLFEIRFLFSILLYRNDFYYIKRNVNGISFFL